MNTCCTYGNYHVRAMLSYHHWSMWKKYRQRQIVRLLCVVFNIWFFKGTWIFHYHKSSVYYKSSLAHVTTMETIYITILWIRAQSDRNHQWWTLYTCWNRQVHLPFWEAYEHKRIQFLYVSNSNRIYIMQQLRERD